MADRRSGKGQDITIHDLYPHLDEEQLKEAGENLERYLELMLRIYERIQRDPEAYSCFRALTGSKRNHKMKDKRSNPHGEFDS